MFIIQMILTLFWSRNILVQANKIIWESTTNTFQNVILFLIFCFDFFSSYSQIQIKISSVLDSLDLVEMIMCCLFDKWVWEWCPRSIRTHPWYVLGVTYCNSLHPSPVGVPQKIQRIPNMSIIHVYKAVITPSDYYMIIHSIWHLFWPSCS